MRQKTEATKPSAAAVVKDIRRVARKQYGAEEKIRIVLDGLRGEESIIAPCRRASRRACITTGRERRSHGRESVAYLKQIVKRQDEWTYRPIEEQDQHFSASEGIDDC